MHKAIAQILGKSEKYILREFLKPLLDDKKLNYTIPDMINHPNQAYVTIVKTVETPNKDVWCTGRILNTLHLY